MATFRPAPRPAEKPVTPPMRPQPVMGQRPAAPPPKMPPQAPAPAFGGSRPAMPPKAQPQSAPAFGGGRPAMPPKTPAAGLPGMFTAGRSMAQPTQKPAGGLQSLWLGNQPMPVLKAGPEYEAQVQKLKGANSPEAQQQFAGELRSMAGGMPDMQRLASQARQYGLDETAALADTGRFQRFMAERQQRMAQPQAVNPVGELTPGGEMITEYSAGPVGGGDDMGNRGVAVAENGRILSQEEARLAQQRALMERQNRTQFQSPMPIQGNVGPIPMQRLNSMFIPRG